MDYNVFGLKGIANLVTLGKKGLKLKNSANDTLELRNFADNDYVSFKAEDGQFFGDVIVEGNFTVNGTETILNVETLEVEDKNIELGVVETPTDVTANGGGITLKGDTDKTLVWDNTNSNWTSSEHLNLASDKVYKINNVEVLSATALGSSVVSSSLTSVGTLTSGALGTGFTTVAVAQGGTGATTLTEHGVLVGNGTSAISALTVGTDNQVLIGSTGSAPSFGYVDSLRDVTSGLVAVKGVAAASSVNYIEATASVTTEAVKLEAKGTDDNIDLVLGAKGTGAIEVVSNIDVGTNVIGTSETNGDIVFAPDGTGVLSVAGTTDYEANVTSDDDIPNKAYVDQTVTDNAGNIVRRETEEFASGASSVNIGDVLPNPDTQDVFVNVLTVNVATALVAAGAVSPIYARITDGTQVLMGHEEIDVEEVGVYKAFTGMSADSNGAQLVIEFFEEASYTTPLTVDSGSITVTIECLKH